MNQLIKKLISTWVKDFHYAGRIIAHNYINILGCMWHMYLSVRELLPCYMFVLNHVGYLSNSLHDEFYMYVTFIIYHTCINTVYYKTDIPLVASAALILFLLPHIHATIVTSGIC